MNNNDDFLNKYIDNELTRKELDQFEVQIETDNKFNSMFKVHKYVHNSLYEMEHKSAPDGFTDIIMKKIVKKLSSRYHKNYMFRFVISLLTIFLLISLSCFSIF